jgi:hypothetical protein
MRTLRFASAACVLALAGLLVGDQAFSGDKKDTAEWTVIIKSAKVKNTKADGSAWDPMDGAPDLFVRVRVDDKAAKDFDTKVVKDDAYEATFNTDTNVRFRIGQKVILTVIDKDVAANDDCGTYNLITTEPVITKGKLRLENFGQVMYLDVEFKKL